MSENENTEVAKTTKVETHVVPGHEDRREELRTPPPAVVEQTVTETVHDEGKGSE